MGLTKEKAERIIRKAEIARDKRTAAKQERFTAAYQKLREAAENEEAESWTIYLKETDEAQSFLARSFLAQTKKHYAPDGKKRGTFTDDHGRVCYG